MHGSRYSLAMKVDPTNVEFQRVISDNNRYLKVVLKEKTKP